MRHLFKIFPCLLVIGVGSEARAASVVVELLALQHDSRVFVPTDGSLGTSWQAPGFDDSGWRAGGTPIGYGYPSGELEQVTNIGPEMRNLSPSAYVRSTFDLDVVSVSQVESLELDMYFDDGFVAFLNGTRVASDNAAADPLSWDSVAPFGAEAFDGRPVSFDLSSAIPLLLPGNNVLAIHGMNANIASSDFLVAPVLSATIDQVPEPNAAVFILLGGLLAVLRRGRC